MCREIVTLQVGQAGNQVGTQFWDAIRKEHGLGVNGKVVLTEGEKHFCEDELPDKLANLAVMFNPTLPRDTCTATWVPRAILVDLEPSTLDDVRAHPIGPTFRTDNMIFAQNGAGNNWAKGFYTEGAELVEEIMDRCRREVESADCIQGFQLIHSVGGGTGSGLGTLVLNHLRDNYCDRITSSYTIFPNKSVSATVIEPYNAIFSTHQLIENSMESFILDNEAIQSIAKNVLRVKQPDFSVLNQLIAQVSCGVSSSLRFPGTLNSDLRKLAVNMVPFPRLHFFMCSHAPIASKESTDRTKLNIRELVSQGFSRRNFFCNINQSDGHYLASAIFFRGEELSEQEVDENLGKIQKKHSDDFVEWIPNNLLCSLIRTPGKSSPISATMIGNTCAMKTVFQRLLMQYSMMYKRRAFLHYYIDEGMDHCEFLEAEKNVRDLVTEFQDKTRYAIYEEEDDSEDI